MKAHFIRFARTQPLSFYVMLIIMIIIFILYFFFYLYFAF